MTDLAPILTSCTVCRHPRRDEINRGLREGRSLNELELISGKTRQTLWTHKRKHMTTAHVEAVQQAQRAMERQQQTIKGPSRRDVLEQVVESVATGIAAGILQPNISDGIKADIAIRNLAEKGADRDFMLQLAQTLGGSFPMVIEGSFRDVTPEAIEDAEEFALLTA